MATGLTRWRPFAELEDLRGRVDRMFSEMENGETRKWHMALDVIERDDKRARRGLLGARPGHLHRVRAVRPHRPPARAVPTGDRHEKAGRPLIRLRPVAPPALHARWDMTRGRPPAADAVIGPREVPAWTIPGPSVAALRLDRARVGPRA
jgi:hypothetical protein